MLSTFLVTNSVTSLSDVVFEWKGFILESLEFYRQWVTEPIRSVAEAVGLTYGQNEIDAIMVLSMTTFSMMPLSQIIEARDKVRKWKNVLEVFRAKLEKLLEPQKQRRELIEQYRVMVEQLKARGEPYTGTFEEYDASEELLEEQEANQAENQSEFLELERLYYSLLRSLHKLYMLYAGGFLFVSTYAAYHGFIERPSRWWDLPLLLCLYLWVGYKIDNRKHYFAPGIVAVSIVLLLGAINGGLTRT